VCILPHLWLGMDPLSLNRYGGSDVGADVDDVANLNESVGVDNTALKRVVSMGGQSVTLLKSTAATEVLGRFVVTIYR